MSITRRASVRARSTERPPAKRIATATNATDLRYPVGRYDLEAGIAESDRPRLIASLAQTPARLRAAVAGLSDAQLDTPYRPGGWTVRQVVHHVPDSHLNAYLRMKLALTEPEPVIKPYDQELWAELADSKAAPIDVSLALLDALHRRWVRVLNALRSQDFARAFRHPELGLMTLNQQLGYYEWHGRHHVGHVTSLIERMGWKKGRNARREV